MDKRWSKTEVAVLKRQAGSKSPEELAQKFRTDIDTVRRKLQELGLVSSPGSLRDEPLLDDYGAGCELLGQKKWKKAAEKFEKVLAGTDSRRLRDRARQSLEICHRRLEADADGEDPYLRAVVAKNRGDLDAALEHAGELGGPKKDERSAYLLASLHALRGDEDEAVELLGQAIELEPKNRVHAFHDPDFEPIRSRDEFRRLVIGR